MTVLESRYVTRARMTGPARDGGRRFGTHGSHRPLRGWRVTKVEQLRERIVLGKYEVDATLWPRRSLARLLERAETSKGEWPPA